MMAVSELLESLSWKGPQSQAHRWADEEYSEDWWRDSPWYQHYEDQWYNWEPRFQMPIYGSPKELREVDIVTDPGIWAILDEGCNTTCHSRSWRLNAQEKLEAMGFCMETCKATKNYNGVGANATKANGLFRIPFSIDIGSDLKNVAGIIASYELDHDSFVPLLLSLGNQATPGLVKDMRHGTCVLRDYEADVELCRAKQNQLLCINIGALGTATRHRQKLPRHLRPLRIDSEEWKSTFGPADSSRTCTHPPVEKDLGSA